MNLMDLMDLVDPRDLRKSGEAINWFCGDNGIARQGKRTCHSLALSSDFARLNLEVEESQINPNRTPFKKYPRNRRFPNSNIEQRKLQKRFLLLLYISSFELHAFTLPATVLSIVAPLRYLFDKTAKP